MQEWLVVSEVVVMRVCLEEKYTTYLTKTGPVSAEMVAAIAQIFSAIWVASLVSQPLQALNKKIIWNSASYSPLRSVYRSIILKKIQLFFII